MPVTGSSECILYDGSIELSCRCLPSSGIVVFFAFMKAVFTRVSFLSFVELDVRDACITQLYFDLLQKVEYNLFCFFLVIVIIIIILFFCLEHKLAYAGNELRGSSVQRRGGADPQQDIDT